MRELFADAHYWVAISNPRDSDHAIAKMVRRQLEPVFLHTTDEILTEFLAAMSHRGPWLRAQAVETVRGLLADHNVFVWPQSRDGFLAALDLYQARHDKGYSLVDCASMVLMRQEGLDAILTRDRHFEQEGFDVLIRD